MQLLRSSTGPYHGWPLAMTWVHMKQTSPHLLLVLELLVQYLQLLQLLL
jgi:hypothetical protein